MTRIGPVALLTVMCLAFSGSAFAQAPVTTRITVGAAAGIALPFHGDFDFNAPAWQVDARIDVSRHFGVGVFLEEWRHVEEAIFANQMITGPTGLIGRAERITVRTTRRTYTAGWHALARGRAGRLTVSGGGGAGIFVHSRNFRQTMAGCEPSSLCRDVSQDFKSGSLSAHVQTGADVAMTRRVAAMGQFRLVIPVQDAGSSHSSVMAGVRVGF